MCTIMQLSYKDNYIFAKNNDTFFKDGMIFTNHKGIKKKALILPPNMPVEWVSKYGSISFSQCGKELPVGGMNEKGLVVEQTTLLETMYPSNMNKGSIKELQLIQYLLDTCSDVKQAIQQIEKINIAQATWTIQYILSDQLGDMAIIQYLNGRANIYTDDNLTIRGITNSIYKESLDAYECGLLNNSEISDYKKNSLGRFMKVAQFTKNNSLNHISEAFAFLKAVERNDTVWSIAYDSYDKIVYFKIKGMDSIKDIQVNDINFERNVQPMYFDMLSDTENTQFEVYSREINRKLVNSFFENETIRKTMNLSSIPTELIDYLSTYPDLLYMS